MALEIQVMAWDRHNNVAVLYRLTGMYLLSPLPKLSTDTEDMY